jgi:hypothetical protein
MISLSCMREHVHTHKRVHAHTHTLILMFFSHMIKFHYHIQVNTDHNPDTFANKMSPTSLTMLCSMMRSSSEEMVLLSSCVAIMPKCALLYIYIHKWRRRTQQRVEDSDGRFNQQQNWKQSHIKSKNGD